MLFKTKSAINSNNMCKIIVVIKLIKNSSGTIFIRLDSSGLNNHKSLENSNLWNFIQNELKLYEIIPAKTIINTMNANNVLLKVLVI